MEWDEMEIDEDLAAAAFGSSAAAPAHEAGCGGRRHLLHVVLDTNVMLRIGRARARAGAPAQREPLTEQTMMHAVAEQLEAGVPAMTLAGRTDLPKLKSSLLLFERMSRRGDVDSHMACQRALQALGVEVGAGTLPQPHDS